MAFEIRILVDDAGHVNVNGPLQNLPLMYGVLELAKDAVREYARKQAENLVQPATIIPFMPPGGNS